MGVIISAVLVIYFGKNVLDYFSFFKKLNYFIITEKDQLIPNLSFDLKIIKSGFNIVKSLLLLKINLFLSSIWTFSLIIFSEQWPVSEMLEVMVQYILGIIIVINLWIVLHIKYFQEHVLFKGEKVKYRGWDKLQMKITKEDLTFYLIRNELILTGHFEVKGNEHKNNYWKRLAKEEDH